MIDNKVLESIRTRRSIRAFQSVQIKPQELEAVLEAGKWAASGTGAQSPVFVAVQDSAIRDELSRLNAGILGSSGDPFYGAPTVIVVFADTSRSTYVEDGALAIGNMMLAAHSIGLGSCWIHRAREVFQSPEGKALMRKWGIPDGYAGIGHCILGYAKGEPGAGKPRKSDYVVMV